MILKSTEWLGERNNKDELEETIFKASLEKTFKNRVDNNLKEIKLLQTGNSNFTIKDFPLFKNNDRLFLFLKKAVGEGYKNSYWILGGHTGVFRIISIDGKDYAVKQVGNCYELSEAKVVVDFGKIRNSLAKNSPMILFSSVSNIFNETYDLETMEKLIKEQKNK